jgi:tight adherence protein C
VEWIAVILPGLLCFACVVLARASLRAGDAAAVRVRRAVGKGGPAAATPRSAAAERWLVRLEKVSSLAGVSASAGLRQQLSEAGLRRGAALRVYMASRLIGAVGLGGGAIFALSLFPQEGLAGPGLLVGAIGFGYLGPGLVIGMRRSRRQRTIVRSLPDAIDLMVVCVEAGLSLGATIDRVAREFARAGNDTLSGELRLVVLETQAGKSLSESLRGLGTRTGVQDLSTLTSALIQTERMGTRVADTLRVQADALRTRRLQRAEEVAQRAPVKMLFPAGVFIFPVLLAVTLVPAFLGTSKLFE